MKSLIRKILREEVEQGNIDKNLLNMLLRRANVEEKEFGFDGKPIRMKTISFRFEDDVYTITAWQSKKDNIKKIMNMLWENNIVDLDNLTTSSLDTERQKIVQTIKHFIKIINLYDEKSS